MKDMKLVIPRVFEVYVDGVKANECQVHPEYPYIDDNVEPHNKILADYYRLGYRSVESVKLCSWSLKRKRYVCPDGFGLM